MRDNVDDALDRLTASFLNAVNRHLEAIGRPPEGLGAYLSVLYDLSESALYANATQIDGKFVSEALACNEALFFPHTWMCPRCLQEGKGLRECYLPGARLEKGRYYPDVERLAKPGGRAIGDYGIKIIKAILRALLSKTNEDAVIRDGGGLRGEFDLTIASNEFLAFVEVKAKPLICYPIKVTTKGRANEHKWVAVNPEEISHVSMVLAANNFEVRLDSPSDDNSLTWPLDSLCQVLEETDFVVHLIENWMHHLRNYRAWVDEPRETRWHRFGCGNFGSTDAGKRVEMRVANTKELPGLDRTDDIKKGAAQLLKFSRFKFDCSSQQLYTILLGNTYAETHGEDYADPLAGLRVTRDTVQPPVWIFDAMIGLTKNIINNPVLIETFNFGRLFSR